MTTAITRLAKEVRDEYYPVDFDERLDRLAKIVLELELGLSKECLAGRDPLCRCDVCEALARCQQIASGGK